MIDVRLPLVARGGKLRSSARCQLFAVISLFCLLGAGQSSFAQSTENREYCSAKGRLVFFLLDVTTPYDQTDRNSIVRVADDVLSAIAGGDRLLIRTIADSHTRSERLIERCIPYCPEETMWGKMFKCSDGRIRTDLETVRAEVVKSLRDRLQKFEELPYSDIVRTIQSVTSEDVAEGHEVRMYLYSDLIENSDYFPSKYLFSFPLPRLMYGIEVQYKLLSNLKGAEVRVAGVGRAGTKNRRPLSVIELNKLTQFWTAYFKASGAKLVTIGRDGVGGK